MATPSVAMRTFLGYVSCHSLAQLCAVLVLCCGVLVLLGWGYDVPALRTFVPGIASVPPMKPNTALGFAAASSALLLSSLRLHPMFRLAAGLLASLPLLLGLFALAVYMSGVHTSVDQLVFDEAMAQVQPALSGQLAPTAALGFVLLGFALLLLVPRRNSALWVVQFLAAINGLNALLILLGYLSQDSGVHGTPFGTSVALPTAGCLLLMSVGIFALRPQHGLVALLMNRTPASAMLRRLLLSSVVIVLAVELAYYVLHWETLFGSGFRSVVLIAVATLAAINIAYRLEGVDAKRRENEERYRTLFELSPYGIFIQRDEQIVFCNSALARLLQAPNANALVGVSIWSLIHHDDHSLIRERLSQLRRPGDHAPMIEQLWLRRDGKLVNVEVTSSVIRDAGQLAVLVMVQDISERKRLQAQLAHAQRMESIGRLAGGIAHDFNNLLAVVIGCSSLATEALPPDHPVQDDLREIQNVSNRATTLIRQLLTFARRQPTQPQQLNLNNLVCDIERLLRHLLPKNIRLTFKPGGDLELVQADASQLEQVIMNLVVNARDAMPDGGQITVETTNVVFDAAYVRQHLGSSVGPHVMLAVSDTGVGMSAEVQQRAFEPFFSTKPQSEGTGLGLATCYGIVKQHSGNIWMYSEVGHGTTVKVYLPCVAGQANDDVALQQANELSSALQAQGHETVLVVEDTDELRHLVARTLELYGYTVLQAADGDEALRLAALAPQPVSILLTDVMIPNINGYKLAEALTARWPHLRVLFTSGYTDTILMQQGQLAHPVAYLEKPFSPTMLARKVREVLDVP